MYPTLEPGRVGWLTETEMVEVDRVMIEDLGIELIQMMENAGRSLARFTVDLLSPATIVVVCGRGGNGGGGLVAARHLANAGVDVVVALTGSSDRYRGVSRHQLDIVTRMGIARIGPDRLDEVEAAMADTSAVVDAAIGYSLRGAPTGYTAEVIGVLNRAGRPVVALDTPSGLDVTAGEAPGVVATATATLTLAAPKSGLADHPSVGDLYLADISVPPSVLANLDRTPPDFSGGPVVRIGPTP